MKLLQFNINSLILLLMNCGCRYQKENNYDGKETKYTGEKPLGNSKHWSDYNHIVIISTMT